MPVNSKEKTLSKKPKKSSESINLKDIDAKERECLEDKLFLNKFTIDQLRDMAFWTWSDGRIFFVNEEACRSLGYTRQELLSMGIPDIDVNFPPDRLSRFIENNKHSGFVLMESRFKTKDGRTFPVEISSNYFHLDDKEYMVSLCRDITERKRADEALRESEKKYRSLAEHVNDWVWEIDANGTYTYVSPRVRDLLGYEPDEVIGTSPFDYMPPEESKRVRARFEPIFEANEEFTLLENTLIKKDGSTVTVETSGVPIFDARGTFTGYRGSDRDITGRKRAEDALRESEEKYRIVADNTYDWEFWLSPEGQVLYTSPSCERITGYSAGELTKDPGLLYNITHPEDKPAFRAHIHAKQPSSHSELEFRIVLRDGEVRWIHHLCQPVYDRDEHLLGYRGSNRDITERKRAEEAIMRSEQMLQLVMDNIPQAIFWKDRNSTYIGCNKVLAKATGLGTPRDIMGKTDYDLPWSREQADFFRAHDRMVMENDTPEHKIVEQQREASGRTAWVETNKVPLHDLNGNVTGILGTYEDITERKRAEEALRESQAHLNSIFRAAPSGIGVVVDRVITEVNDRLCEMTGYTREELLGKTARVLYPTDEDYEYVGREKYAQIDKLGTGNVETRWHRKDGRVIDVLLSSTPMEPGDLHMGVTFTALDITKRKRAEEALRINERFLNNVFDGIQDGICVLDKDLNIIRVNKTMERWNHDMLPLVGKKCYHAYHCHSAPCEYCPNIKAVNEKAAQVKIVPREVAGRIDGWHEIYSYPLLDDKGDVIGVIDYVRDITQRKMAEDAVRLANAYNRSLIEASLDPLVTIAPDGKITDVNQATEMATGISRDDLVGTDFSNYFTDPDMARKGYKKVFEVGSVKDYPLEIKHRDGRITPVIYNASVYRDESGKVIGVFAAARDITERRRAEEALKKSEANLDRAQRIAVLGNWEWDLRTNQLSGSREYYRIFGFDPLGSVPFEKFLGMVHPDDRKWLEDTIKDIHYDNLPRGYEFRILLPDGRERYIHSDVEVINDEYGQPVKIFGTMHDITERKHDENALREAKDQVELYVDLMGHDINNMNQVSMGFLELAHNIIEMEGKLGEDNIVLLDKAMDSLKNSSQLIDNVRKLQREKMGLYEPEVLNVGTVIEDAVKHFQTIPGRDVMITCKPYVGSHVRANGLLKDVFVNLVGNAVKHSRGSLSVNIGISKAVDNGKTYCRVNVEDDGPGIPDTLKHTLFDRLNLTTTRAKGKGFGLCLIKMLMDDYHGKFWVEDRVPGDHTKGARFVVMLPAVEK